ncbi:MAG: TRZ/ATZ family hydrolase [Nevskiales bacterium]
MKQVELLIQARWVIPVEPAKAVLEHHSLAVDAGRIVALLPTAEAKASFQPKAAINLERHALLPGFVNAHTHAAMTLFRGLADDLALMDWLQNHVWPAEGKWVTPEFCADGVELACAEMLRGGVTLCNDMYFFPDVSTRVAARVGMRATVGMILLDFPSAWAQTPEEYLRKGLQVRDHWRGHPLINTIFAPHAPYTVSDEPLKKLREYADEMDVPVHMHVHETAFEVESAQKDHGERPLARLDKLGLLNPGFIAVHMTQLSEAEIALCAGRGINIVHCPESNLKLASGFCPVAALQKAGVNVALGTDGAASNNDLDLMGEMKTAALLGKAVAGDAAALPAHTALHMATLAGAKALGLGEVTGSLVAGKWADLCAIELGQLETQPLYHAISQLVYSADRAQVSDVWVAGQRLLDNRRLTTIDETDLARRVADWNGRIAGTIAT